MSRASVYQYPTNTGSQGSGSLQQQQQANANRSRQYSHLNAQLAQLNAHLADTENLLRMTAVQADYIRGLGGWCGGLFMASAKILGEETVAGNMNGASSEAAAAVTAAADAHDTSTPENSTSGVQR